MAEPNLTAEARTKLGSRESRRLVLRGLIPAVLYSKKDPQAHPLMVKKDEFALVLKRGERVIDLRHPGGQEKVLVKDVQWDPLGERILHVDFNKIALDEVITVDVALELKGVPVGVSGEGGVLENYIKTVKVQCLPTSIPKSIVIDVSGLKLNQNLHVREIPVAQGLKLVQDADLVVASVHPPRVEETAAAAEAAAAAEPEVITKKAEAAPEEEGKEGKEGKKEAPKAAAPPKKE